MERTDRTEFPTSPMTEKRMNAQKAPSIIKSAMSKVDHANNPKHKGVAHRKKRIEAAELQPVDQKLKNMTQNEHLTRFLSDMGANGSWHPYHGLQKLSCHAKNSIPHYYG